MKDKLILATDLDGTFLDGPEDIKQQFYEDLINQQDEVAVVFVTGRSLHLVEKLYDEGFAFRPDYIIADHGTIIVHGHDLSPMTPIQEKITAQWHTRQHDELVALVAAEPSLEAQPWDMPHRHAYYYSDASILPRVIPAIEDLGFHAIASHGAYLDILPEGFNKGLTVQHLLDHLEVEKHQVLACGDSLNDLPLFQAGFASIAVGNSEPGLVDKIQSMPNVYHSQYPGVAGIIDGINFLFAEAE